MVAALSSPPVVRQVARPLVYVAPALPPWGDAAVRPTATRRLASVVEEFGLAAHRAAGTADLPLAPDDEAALHRAALIVCELPAADWMPSVEISLPAARLLPVLALVPSGEVLAGATAELLADATIVRYAGRPAGRALHAHLRELGAENVCAARA